MNFETVKYFGMETVEVRDQLERVLGLEPEIRGLDLTVLCVPTLLDSGDGLGFRVKQ